MTDIRLADEAQTPPRPPATRRHLLAVSDLERGDIERILGTAVDARTVARPRSEEAPGPAWTAGHQPLLRVVDPHAVELRARGQAALGRHDVGAVVRLLGRQGRVAQGYGAHSRRLRPGRDRHPASAHRCPAARRLGVAGPRRQRRRRQAPAPDAGAARPVHDARGTRSTRRTPRRHRRRRAALASGSLPHRGARARRRAHDARRAADADPARDRGDGM